MKIKNIVLLFSGCVIINSIAMEKESITNDQFRKKQQTLYYQSRKNGANETINKEMENLLIQSIHSGNATPSTITVDSKFDILGYGIKYNYKELITYCFKQGYSPDNPVLYNGKKIPALTIASFDLFPLFKKYNAHFNIMLKDKNHRTLLHKFMSNHNNEIAWLLKETTIDINQPDGYGNNVGHILADSFYVGNDEKNKRTFQTIIQHGINPFQKNNDNQTPREIAYEIALDYQKRLVEDPNGINLQAFHYRALKMLSLWEKYEKEYQENSINKPVKKHCYCENFAHLNKKDIALQSTDFPLEQIQDAYSFFPQDSCIGFFCKQNPTHIDCITVAKHYLCFNNVHHLAKKRSENWSQYRILEKEKHSIGKQIAVAENQMFNLSNKAVVDLLDPEIKKKYSMIDQLPAKEQFALYDIIAQTRQDILGITPLNKQIDSINEQLQQLENEDVSGKEKKARKKIYGYYSALDFAVCAGKSSYHRAVKNLLAMLSDEQEKYKEAAKINEGLHNAYHNKKQS